MNRESRRHLLLIDSDDHLRDHLARYLSFRDYDITAKSNALDGLWILEKYSFPVVLVDFDTRFIGGVEFLKRARELRPQTRIVFLNSSQDTTVIRKMMRSGADGMVFKPVQDMKLFNQTLDKAYEAWDWWQERIEESDAREINQSARA